MRNVTTAGGYPGLYTAEDFTDGNNQFMVGMQSPLISAYNN
jgi:hypothetical protein